MRCSKCGAEINPGAKFCIQCGQSVDAIDRSAARPSEMQGKTVVQYKKKSGISIPIIVLIVVLVLGMAGGGFALWKHLSDKGDETADGEQSTSEQMETPDTPDESSSDNNDSSAENESTMDGREKITAGISPSNTGDYENVMNGKKYESIEDEDFTFIYPANFYSNAYKEVANGQTEYYFETQDGQQTLSMRKYKEDSDDGEAIVRALKMELYDESYKPEYCWPLEKGDADTEPSRVQPGKKEAKGKEKYYGVISCKTDSSEKNETYRSIVWEDGMVYVMDTTNPTTELYFNNEKKKDKGRANYLIDCLYRGMNKTYLASKGAAVRSYDDFYDDK